MDISAEQVRSACISSRNLDQQINQILKAFQATILSTSKEGGTGASIAIPTNFSISNMDNKTIQTIIYSRLIDELEKKGFGVRVSMSETSVIYHVQWNIEKANKDLGAMRAKIAAHVLIEPPDADSSAK